MSTKLDPTHDPALRSWIASANDPATDFPIQNLPYGRFRRRGTAQAWRIGVAIGDQVLDLRAAIAAGLGLHEALGDDELNRFMGLGTAVRAETRAVLCKALTADSGYETKLRSALMAQADAELSVPCHIGDYTDFYTGIHHAMTVGKLFRPDNPLMPNYKWVPIGYHGRGSSIGVSGQMFKRPVGQLKGAADAPQLGATQRLDYELEVAAFIATPNELGTRVTMDEAEDHIFGFTLFNDWSARDVQSWEYQPLGPFNSKNFASTISPWLVTLEALEPFRSAWTRPAGDPQPLPYLDSATNRERGAVDIALEVWLQTAGMRDAGVPAVRLTQSNFTDAYWTVAQMVTHHTIGGCNLQPGDLLGSGTLSGPGAAQSGSLLELSQNGKQPFTLPNGETRTFLQDGDTVILRGSCSRPGFRRIGFGDCAGTVLPATAID